MTLTTLSRIKAFQKKHGLVVDGIIGPQTRKVIAELAKPPSSRARVEPDKSAMDVPLRKADKSLAVGDDETFFTRRIATPKTARFINEIIVHCTATPEGRWYDRADVNAWHKQRGWEMIGYHFLILLDGTIVIGRPIGMIGAHCMDHNTGTVGVAYVGGVAADGKRPKDTRNAAQKAALAWLCRSLKSDYAITKRIKGHNEYDRGKACPSFNMNRDFLATL
jgi:N-acetylmuramoyl-L-alanine amidase